MLALTAALAAVAAPEKHWYQTVSIGFMTNRWLSAADANPLRLTIWAIHRHRTFHFIRAAQAPCSIKLLDYTPVVQADSGRLAKRLRKTSAHLEGFALGQHVIARARQFVSERLSGDDRITLAFLTFVEALRLRAVAQRHVRCLHESPGEILVAVLRVPFAFLLRIALAQ